MKNAVPHHLRRFLRHIDVAPEKRIVKADLTRLAVRHFFAVFAQQPNPNVLEHRLPDGRYVVTPVHDKLRHMEARFAHSVIVDQLNPVKIYPIGSLAPCHQGFETGCHPVRHDTKNGGRQERQIHPVFHKLLIHLNRIFCGVRAENDQAHA